MNYEQKYNEAIKRAKALLDGEASSPGRKKWIGEIFPELCESEDERIRRTLVEYFGPGVQLDFVRGIPIQKIRDWLEKKKERGPLTNEEEYTLHRIIEYLEDETCPSEWISLLHDIYCLPYEKQKEQKPAEWRDKDEKIVGLIKKVLYDCKNGTEHAIGDKDYSKCIAWIESNSGCCGEINDEALQEQYEIWIEKGRCSGRDEVIFHPEKFGLCKPAEWSEEDEEVIQSIAEKLHKRGFTFLADYVTRLRPSWKPSKEQMEALKEASTSWMNEKMGNAKILASLYEQLKNL